MCEAVPWASCQTVIAAIDPVSNGRPELNGYGALKFDGEVGNTTTGIQLKGTSQRSSWTGVQAPRAGATTIPFGAVGFKLEGGHDFAQEQPIPQTPAHQVGVFADKANAGALGQVAFQERPGIRVPEGTSARAAELANVIRQNFETFANNIVIIREAGVTRDEADQAGRGRGRLRVCVCIAGRKRDNASSAGEDQLRIGSLGSIPFNITHLAVVTGGELVIDGGYTVR